MSRPFHQNLPVVPHSGYLGEQHSRPDYLQAEGISDTYTHWPFSIGGSLGQISLQYQTFKSEAWDFKTGIYLLRCYFLGQYLEHRAHLGSDGLLETASKGLIAAAGSAFLAELELNGELWTVLLREQNTEQTASGYTQRFAIYRTLMQRTDRKISSEQPDSSAVHFRVTTGEQRSVYPLQLNPSVLDVTGRRISLNYEDAIERLADLMLAHRLSYGRTTVYIDENTDYFAHFALQEVGRLLGIRNLYGGFNNGGAQNLEAGAERQRGNGAPFVSLDMALNGSQRVFLLNGWNGFITHLPLFERLIEKHTQIFLIESVVTETARVLVDRLGPEHVLLIKPGTEGLLALAIAHDLLERHPGAISGSFIETFADSDSFDAFVAVARGDAYAGSEIAQIISAEPAYTERISSAIGLIADALAKDGAIPIHVPGSGLLQSSGTASYCLWTNMMAMLGKFGINSSGDVLGGELLLFEQSNQATQLLGLGPDKFFGNIPLDDPGCREAARRMELPEETYLNLFKEPINTIQESVESQKDLPELIVCIGNGLEASWMRNHEFWQQKLAKADVTLVVLDANPGPWLLKNAALCLVPTPEIASYKLNLSGEWRLTQAYPRRVAPRETRTESTILYDLMAQISVFIREEMTCRDAHPDLAQLVDDGYLQVRFEPPEWGWGGHLKRIQGEVSRELLWARIQTYLGAERPLYCRPEESTERPLSWLTLQHAGNYLLGSLRERAFAGASLFQSRYREPFRFTFFLPTEDDLALPLGMVLKSGSSIPNADWGLVRFAIASSYSSLALDHPQMPEKRFAYISGKLARELHLKDLDRVKILDDQGLSMSCVLRISSDIKGEMVYFHHYLTRQEMIENQSFPWLRFQPQQSPYSQESLLRNMHIQIERDA